MFTLFSCSFEDKGSNDERVSTMAKKTWKFQIYDGVVRSHPTLLNYYIPPPEKYMKITNAILMHTLNNIKMIVIPPQVI